MLFDIIIIGGGPAGLTAGLYASRARLKCLLIEKGLLGGQVATTELIENYPGFEQGITGVDLSAKMEEQAKKFGLETIQAYVENISSQDKIKKITLEGGEEYETRTIILGTGAKPTRLGVKGEGKFRGKGVSYCATCDGAFYKGETIAVVGGGNSGVEEAVFLTKFAEKVYVIHRRDKLRADKIAQERAFSNNRVEFKWDTVIEEITGENEVKALHLKNVKTQEKSVLNVTGLFIYIGYNPNTGFIKDIVKLDENNYIIADFDMSTSVPGIFAAGDVVSGSVKQISVAVGQGTIAALSAQKYIEEHFS